MADDESYLRPGNVAKMLDCSVSTVWRIAREDRSFPQPKRLGGNMTVWNKAELLAYLKELPSNTVARKRGRPSKAAKEAAAATA